MRIFLALIFVLCAPISAWAEQCYQPSEYEAEQVVRFQTQLMVIAMMCDPHSDDELYNDYQSFSQTNDAVIKGNEKTLLQYFKTHDAPSSEKSLHTLRTDIANEMAQYASAQVPSKFCRKFASRIDEAVHLQPDDLTVLISDMGYDLPSSQPLCIDN